MSRTTSTGIPRAPRRGGLSLRRPAVVVRLFGLLASAVLSAGSAANADDVLVVRSAEQLDTIPAHTRVLRVDLGLYEIPTERQQKLRAWVTAGGVAWVHTDAALALGFHVTAPQSGLEATGKAVAAAPFAASPLLEGVEKVRYALAPGEPLLKADGIVLPILQVADTSVYRQEPVLIAGWKRVGFGEVFFLAGDVSRTLLDGARLWSNWATLIAQRPRRLFVPVDALLAISGVKTESANVEALSPAQTLATADAWMKAFDSGDIFSAAGGGNSRGYIPLDDDDLNRLRRALGMDRPASVARAAPDAEQAQALAAAWLGREQYQTGHVPEALEWLDVALGKNPRLDLAHAWRGCVLWTQAEHLAQPAPQRAALLEQAAEEFDAAQYASGVSAFPKPQLRHWAEQARLRAARYRLEPPLATVEAQFVIRHAPGDASVGQAAEGLHAALGIIASEFGIRLDGTEVLLFPSFEDYASYMAAAGYEAVTEWEAASSAGKRIFSYLQPGRDYAATMAHELGHAAVGSLAEGGAPVPQWINEGIACAVTPGQPDPRPVTAAAFQEGALMGIADLNAPPAAYDRGPATLLYCQSHQMVRFMAQAFGKHAVLNILREIGWGASADEAMRRVIGMDQAQFLDFWVAQDFP